MMVYRVRSPGGPFSTSMFSTTIVSPFALTCTSEEVTNPSTKNPLALRGPLTLRLKVKPSFKLGPLSLFRDLAPLGTSRVQSSFSLSSSLIKSSRVAFSTRHFEARLIARNSRLEVMSSPTILYNAMSLSLTASMSRFSNSSR